MDKLFSTGSGRKVEDGLGKQKEGDTKQRKWRLMSREWDGHFQLATTVTPTKNKMGAGVGCNVWDIPSNIHSRSYSTSVGVLALFPIPREESSEDSGCLDHCHPPGRPALNSKVPDLA